MRSAAQIHPHNKSVRSRQFGATLQINPPNATKRIRKAPILFSRLRIGSFMCFPHTPRQTRYAKTAISTGNMEKVPILILYGMVHDKNTMPRRAYSIHGRNGTRIDLSQSGRKRFDLASVDSTFSKESSFGMLTPCGGEHSSANEPGFFPRGTILPTSTFKNQRVEICLPVKIILFFNALEEVHHAVR
jgi:hypothetical protein